MSKTYLSLAFIYSLSATTYSLASETIISGLYGPYYSSSFYEKFTYSFTESAAQKAKCQIKAKYIENMSLFLKKLTSEAVDFSFVPSHYAKALEKYGFTPLLRSNNHIQLALISKTTDSSIQDISQFRNKTIYVPGKYTRAYLLLEDWLEEADLNGHITKIVKPSHDQSLIHLLKEDSHGAVVSTGIISRLPNNIKSHIRYHRKSNYLDSIFVVKNQLKGEIKHAFISESFLISFGSWSEATQPIKHNKLSDRFEKQLNDLLATP